MNAAVSALGKSTLGPGMGVLGAGAAAAGALTNGAEKQKGWWVPDGFEAVRTRFGRAVFKKGSPVIHKAGFHPTMPFTHANKFVSIQNRVTDLGNINIERNDELTVVHAAATWGIANAHKAWLKIKDGELDQNFAAVCGNGLRIVLSTIPVDRDAQKPDWTSSAYLANPEVDKIDEILNRKRKIVEAICLKTSYVCQDEFDEIGVELRGISIRSDAIHPIERLRSCTTTSDIGAFATNMAGVDSPNLGIIPATGA